MIITADAPGIDISLTLDCGQAFRWTVSGGTWHGISGNHVVDVSQKDDTLTFAAADENDIPFWKDYFDLYRDYDAILKVIKKDSHIKTAAETFPGIHILNQDPFETLISFIISQNNNIPRIKGIISRLCDTFGEDINGTDRAFPDAEVLASQSIESLAPLRSGFRAKYILDAARKVSEGKVVLSSLKDMPTADASLQLQSISGVGPKVAACTLLYGCRHIDSFPIDVWVRRVMAEMYPDGLPECTKGYEGIAQQYLFHYIRNR